MRLITFKPYKRPLYQVRSKIHLNTCVISTESQAWEKPAFGVIKMGIESLPLAREEYRIGVVVNATSDCVANIPTLSTSDRPRPGRGVVSTVVAVMSPGEEASSSQRPAREIHSTGQMEVAEPHPDYGILLAGAFERDFPVVLTQSSRSGMVCDNVRSQEVIFPRCQNGPSL